MKDPFLIFKITSKGATSHPGWQYPQFPPLTCWCFRLPFFLVRVEHQYFPSGSFLKLKIEIGSGKSSSYKNVNSRSSIEIKLCWILTASFMHWPSYNTPSYLKGHTQGVSGFAPPSVVMAQAFLASSIVL